MKKIIQTFYIEITLVIVFVIQFLSNISVIDKYSFVAYLMNYETGFGVRKLIGTIADTVIPSSINYKSGVYIFVGFFTLLLIVLVAWMTGRFLKSITEKRLYYFSLFLVLLYVLNPASIALFFPFHNFGRLDMYVLILTLLGAAILCSKNWFYKTRFIWLFIICCLCCLIHQMFIFAYFPIIAALVIYDAYVHQFDKKTLVPILLLFVFTGGLSLFLQFSQHIDISYDEIMALIQAKVPTEDIHQFEKPIRFEYFANVHMHLEEYVFPRIIPMFIRFIVTLVLMSPLLVFLRFVWKRVLKYADKKAKIVFNVMQICSLAILPLFIFTVDHGRWFAAYFIFQFILLFVLIYKKDHIMLQAIESLFEYFKTNIALFAMLLIYLASLGYFQAYAVIEPAERIFILLSSIIS